MSNSVWPHRQQPTRLPRPWDSPGKNTGVGCHFLLQCMKVKSESKVAQSCPTLATPWTAAYQAPPPMGFSRPEYWSGLPLPSPGWLTLVPFKSSRGTSGGLCEVRKEGWEHPVAYHGRQPRTTRELWPTCMRQWEAGSFLVLQPNSPQELAGGLHSLNTFPVSDLRKDPLILHVY